MNLIERYINEIVNASTLNWCINNLSISNGVGDIVPIVPTTAQNEILANQEKSRAYLLPRRSGKTMLICMESISEAINNPGQNIVIAVHTSSSVNYITRLIANMLESSNLMDSIVRVTRENIIFTNQSRISIIIPNRSNTRGLKADIAYIDEFDSLNEDALSSVFMCIASVPGSKILMLGTQASEHSIVRSQIRNMRPITIERNDV